MLARAEDTKKTSDEHKLKLDKDATDAPGLHRLLPITDRIYSGGEPQGEEGFKTLKDLGVKTVVCVDGARPNLEAAKKYGLRYVHIPIGYDGISKDAGAALAQLVQEADGPFYVHCHHGRHRGPAAAAIACIADGAATSESALQILDKAGTSEKYAGLRRDVQAYLPPPAGAKLPKLVEVAKVDSLAAAMARLDRAFDDLKLCREAEWKTPAEHPDFDPSRAALILNQGFQDVSGQPSADYKEPFQTWLAEAIERSTDLRTALKSGDAELTTRHFTAVEEACNKCHSMYRDH